MTAPQSNHPSVVTIKRLVMKIVLTPPFDNMPLRQLCMLAHAYDGPVTIRGLSAMMKVDKPALSRFADTLEKLDLIVRTEEPGDRRSVVLTMTPQGQRYWEKLAGL